MCSVYMLTFCCYDKIPNLKKTNTTKGGFILVLDLRWFSPLLADVTEHGLVEGLCIAAGSLEQSKTAAHGRKKSKVVRKQRRRCKLLKGLPTMPSSLSYLLQVLLPPNTTTGWEPVNLSGLFKLQTIEVTKCLLGELIVSVAAIYPKGFEMYFP